MDLLGRDHVQRISGSCTAHLRRIIASIRSTSSVHPCQLDSVTFSTCQSQPHKFRLRPAIISSLITAVIPCRVSHVRTVLLAARQQPRERPGGADRRPPRLARQQVHGGAGGMVVGRLRGHERQARLERHCVAPTSVGASPAAATMRLSRDLSGVAACGVDHLVCCPIAACSGAVQTQYYHDA